MIRSLIALAFGIPLLMGPSKDVRAGPGLETSNLKPYEQVREYLDSSGVGKEEFRNTHYFVIGKGGTMYYNKIFIFGDEIFTERYRMPDGVALNKEGAIRIIPPFPITYFFRGILYYDPSKDGFNGNEIEYRNLTEPVKPKEERDLEETPVKCNPNKRGLCI